LPEPQYAWENVRDNLTAYNLRKDRGQAPDSAAVREEAAMARIANSNGDDRVVRNFHNAIRKALQQRFGIQVPVTAHPQLKEGAIQFLRDRDGLGGVPISNRTLIPKSAASLGKWGEARLEQVLKGAGIKPTKQLKTSLGNRAPDRIFNRIIHEAKGGLNVRLVNRIQKTNS
jgi:hypothetical protein